MVSERKPALVFADGSAKSAERAVPAEVAIAMSYRGSSHAVMMATPADLVDFAYGFSLTEGIVGSAVEILEVDVVPFDKGIDLQITLAGDRSDALAARRRSMAGPVGCGLCGLESIDAAMRSVLRVGDGFTLRPQDVNAAVEALFPQQPLFAETRAVHGTGFYRPGEGMLVVREDVGRHNALDKLVGALVRQGIEGATGAVVVTSRLSVEMIQKTATAGATVLIAISNPTALAIDTAEAAGITLIATARGDGFSVYTHAHRVKVRDNG
ncbi:formate dehydrogenase accessory sulfurtransferase FdhD [Martelella endophytica]|uniref:formate dehydrogenase accessory sulfurtransferase FdhD n=1 Tax=Martelella endophytica TaxID=1486262 RepID=UPI0005F13746|nr:formate dehydrogenase accessory sulfurtransferase FdhD [Martelella endophytica]